MFLSKKVIVLASVVFMGIILIVSAVGLYLSTKSDYANHQQIANLDEYTKGKPSDKKTLDYIKYDLYRVINYNTDKAKSNDSIKDIKIRNNTYSQTKSNKTINSVSFIVDIASLKQSYSVKYQWSDTGKRDEGIDEWGTVVECLPIDKLKYGDFECIDDRSRERGNMNSDPVGLILPYTVKYKYTIKNYDVNDEFSDVESSARPNEAVTLNVEAFIPSWDDETTVINIYTSEINDWLRSKKLNPDNYRLNFVY